MQNIREVLRNTDITNYKFASFAFTLLASTCCIALGTGVSYNVTVLQGIGSEEVQQFYGIAASSFQSFEWSYICPSLVFAFISSFSSKLIVDVRSAGVHKCLAFEYRLFVLPDIFLFNYFKFMY